MLKTQFGYWFDKELKVYEFETLTAGAAALPFTAAKLTATNKEAAIRAWVSVVGGDIRYRCDGTAPTASIGHYVADGGTAEIEGKTNLTRFQMIAASGTAAVTISYSRYEE